MFEKGDYVVFGSNGVCRVEKIGSIDMEGISADKIYYTLLPVHSKGSMIFTPVDNKKVFMRSIISKEEAQTLINDIPNIDELPVGSGKDYEETYKEIIKKCECRGLVSLIKALYHKNLSRIAAGKKTMARDERYFNQAEDILYGELAVALDIERDSIKSFVSDQVEHLGTAS